MSELLGKQFLNGAQQDSHWFFFSKHPSFPAGVSCRQENFSYSHRSVFFLSWLPARQRQDGQFVNDLSTCWRCFGDGGGERGTFLPLDVRLLWVNEWGSSVTRNAHSSPANSLLRRRRRRRGVRGGTGLWPNSGHTAGCTSHQLLPVMKNTVCVSAAQEICRSLTAVKVDKRFYEVSSDSLFYSCLLKSYPRVCFPPWVRPPLFELFTRFPLKWCSLSKIPIIWRSEVIQMLKSSKYLSETTWWTWSRSTHPTHFARNTCRQYSGQ